MATADINDLEKWVIGADKKPKFAIYDSTLTTPIPLSTFSGYGVIVFDPNGAEVGRFGTSGMGAAYSTGEISAVSTTSFEVALDHALNTTPGVYEYRVAAIWSDADFTDSDYQAFNDSREPLYLSVSL